MTREIGRVASAAVLAAIVVTGSARAQSNGPWQSYGTENGEWRSYAGNTAGQKYSPLDQIDSGNFSQL